MQQALARSCLHASTPDLNLDGEEQEDWIYGEPPGRVTFVTFAANKVIRIKETYAGLGGSIAEGPKPQ